MTLMTTMIESEPVYVWIVFDYDGEFLGVFGTEEKAIQLQDSINTETEYAYCEKHELQ